MKFPVTSTDGYGFISRSKNVADKLGATTNSNSSVFNNHISTELVLSPSKLIFPTVVDCESFRVLYPTLIVVDPPAATHCVLIINKED